MTSSGLQATDVLGPTTTSSVPILVVDDNAAKRLALRAVLVPLGLAIVEADSGQAALRCVMAQDFAVILLDVRMPVMDGFETAALIRQRRQSEMTPIIFITAYANDEIEQTDRYVEGAVDFMFAPVQPSELRAKVSVFANLFINAEVLATRARGLQTTTDQLTLLTEVAPIGIFQTDAKNRYLYTNPRWSEITGISAEEAAGRSWDIIIDAEQRATLIAESPDAAGYPVGLSHRFEIRPPGSGSRVVLMTSKTIPDADGGIAGWVGTLADVTAEAGAEAAMSDARDKATEASRLKSDFLANMSHEIRTPMNGVIGMIDLLLETDLDARQSDYAQTVRTSGEALLTIISDILDFSKVEAGKLKIENIEFSLGSVVDDVVALLAASAQTKGLELAIIDSSVPAVVSGDPGRVRQVLTNLIDNAIKFTQAGEIEVRVSEVDVKGADALIRFEVSDTGEGIAADKLDVIFQPFVQADTSTSRKYGGTGLGLAISGQLVALMGGDCGVSSRLGEGSDFWFTIRVQAGAGQAMQGPLPFDGAAGITAPVVDDHSVPSADFGAGPAGVDTLVGEDDVTDAPPAAVVTNGHTLIRPRSSGQGHILLAEDNLVNQRVATAMLEKLGLSVDVVADGAEALKAAALTPYQAILMDCQMPVLDGYDATREIRRLKGKARHTPIIAVTASAMKSDQERCLAAGMDDYLAKPLRLEALAGVLARWAPGGSDAAGPGDQLNPPPADPSESAGPVESAGLDPEVLGRLAGLDESAGGDFIAQLAKLFLADADWRVHALREALAEGDADEVSRTAHTLSGASANLGATDLARLCATLATDGATGDLAGGVALLEAVEAELGRLRPALGSLILTP